VVAFLENRVNILRCALGLIITFWSAVGVSAALAAALWWAVVPPRFDPRPLPRIESEKQRQCPAGSYIEGKVCVCPSGGRWTGSSCTVLAGAQRRAPRGWC
jgi:hypothetical protein